MSAAIVRLRFFPARAALSRATVHHRLRVGSPDKARSAASGECAGINASVRLLPGSRCA
ncbi:TPA: hypothetical protein LSH72_004111 [Klebsiella oxytoca]|nr:hypothetical protein [Klebsiella oxytoca]HBL6911868.1 hypothetical protein [Klebsiella oxytoca]HEJ8429148.1 hypothetical protein [Klebsiella oxytoca]